MKAGFSLIELMLALLISSIMVISLYQMLTQTRKAVARVTEVIDIDEPFMALYAQLEKDITGMFAPQSMLKPYIEKELKKGAAKQEQEERKKQGQQKAQIAQQIQAKTTEQKDPVLFLEHKGTDLWLSFITTGGLQVTDTQGKIVPAPFVRRVAYILEKDPRNPAVLRIMYRYETDKTDLKTIRAPQFMPSYEIATGIKNFSVEFTVYEYAEPKKEGAQETKEQENKPAAPLKEWKESEIWDKYKSIIPAYVTIRGVQVDPSGKNEYPFEFMFRVYSYSQYKQPPVPKTTGNPLQDLDKWMKERGEKLLPKNGKP